MHPSHFYIHNILRKLLLPCFHTGKLWGKKKEGWNQEKERKKRNPSSTRINGTTTWFKWNKNNLSCSRSYTNLWYSKELSVIQSTQHTHQWLSHPSFFIVNSSPKKTSWWNVQLRRLNGKNNKYGYLGEKSHNQPTATTSPVALL